MIRLLHVADAREQKKEKEGDESRPSEGGSPANQGKQMSKDLVEIEMEMFDERDRTASVDPEPWAARHPELREEIVRLAEKLNSDDWVVDLPPSPKIWHDEGNVALEAMWSGLEGLLSNAGHDPDLLLGHELKRARTEARPTPKAFFPTPLEFRRTVVYTWVIAALLRHRSRADRFLTQKITYFLERALKLNLFTEHRRMAAGKYNPSARYDDAEPIASSPEKGWITIEQKTRFLPGPNLAEIHEYAPHYIGSVSLANRLIRRLLRQSRDELETWTTVENAALTLIGRRERVTVPAVVETILQTCGNAGRAKRAKPYFSDRAITEALRHLVALGFLNEETVDLPTESSTQ